MPWSASSELLEPTTPLLWPGGRGMRPFVTRLDKTHIMKIRMLLPELARVSVLYDHPWVPRRTPTTTRKCSFDPRSFPEKWRPRENAATIQFMESAEPMAKL